MKKILLFVACALGLSACNMTGGQQQDAMQQERDSLQRIINEKDMELRRYTGPQDLQASAYGIMEPTGERFTDHEAIDVAIVPGMAFDTEGHRLGRGKGYYDRFLSHVPYLYKIGLCFSWQIVDCVPCDEHDIVMDEIIQI
jgi:5-formyltetrahydrofolate cyclo-ligase